MKKLFILGDNLGGGGTLLASTIIEEASCDSSVIELRGWISPKVDVLSFSKFQNVKVNKFFKIIPKWIRRALIVKSLGDGWIILNLTNFPVSKLGVQPGTIEVCLFHNAYFFSTPNGIHNPIPAYFFHNHSAFLRQVVALL